jgi:cytochrome b561
MHLTNKNPRQGMLKDSRSGYGLLSIAIHWISAVLILFLFGLGIYMVDLSYYDDWYHKGPELHISLGLVVLLLMLVRIVWRIINPTPEELSAKRTQNLAAKLVKLGLYAFVFIVLISGYLITTAEGQPASMFNLIKFPVLTELSSQNVDLAGEIHEYLAWGIVILVVLHVAGALLHHFVVRDRTLVRMLKPVKKSTL